jgi:hypothetical protein
MGAKFCKIKENDTTYTLTDQYGQPLICTPNENITRCGVYDFNKIVNNSKDYKFLSEEDLVKLSDVSCSFSNDGQVPNTQNLEDYNYTQPYNLQNQPISINSEDYRKFEFFFAMLPMMFNSEENKIGGYIDKNKIKEMNTKINQYLKVQKKPNSEQSKSTNKSSFVEVPETQYNNIVNIITKYSDGPTTLIFENSYSEDNLMALLFANNFIVDESFKNYFLKHKFSNTVYNNLLNNTKFYDNQYIIEKNLVPSTSKQIIDLDISYYNEQNIIKYYFLLEILSDIYGFLSKNNSGKKYVTIRSRYIIKDGIWQLYQLNDTEKTFYNFDIKFQYNIEGITSYSIDNISNLVNVDIITEMLTIFSKDIIKHLNFINKADIIQNNQEYLSNIQAFYKFCRLKLIYYTLLCIKNIDEKYVNEFIERHLSYCFINLKNSILVKNVDNKSVLLTNKFITTTDDIKKNSSYIHSKNNALKKKNKIYKTYDKSYIRGVFYFIITFVIISIILSLIIYNTDLKNYTNFTADILFIVFALVIYISVSYFINYTKNEYFTSATSLVTPDVNQFLIDTYIQHPVYPMTTNLFAHYESAYVIRCKATSRNSNWGDVYTLFNYNQNDNGGSSYHDGSHYNSSNGNASRTFFSGYAGEVIMIDLGLPIILRRSRIVGRSGFESRMPGLFRIYGTNDRAKFDNNNYNEWNMLYNQRTRYGNIVRSTLQPPPVSGIAGANGNFVGNVEGCKYGCLWYGKRGRIVASYKLGIRYDNEDFSKVVYNDMTLVFNGTDNNSNAYDYPAIRFYLNGNVSGKPKYTNPPGTSLVLVAKKNNNWVIVQDNIKLKDTRTFQTTVFQAQPAIQNATIKTLPDRRFNVFNIDNSKSYRYYALVVNRLAGNANVLNFNEWALFGINPPIYPINPNYVDNIKRGVTIWKNKNYSGANNIMSSGLYNSFRDELKNNINSIEIPKGYRVIIYELENFKGLSKILYNSVSDINKDFIKNISSIKVEVLPGYNNFAYAKAINNDNFYISFIDPTKTYNIFVNNNTDTDTLLVGGGGGGGCCGGGGGGGGQILYYSNTATTKSGQGLILTRGIKQIQIGKGGNPANAINTVAQNGNDTILIGMTTEIKAEGGGGGGSQNKAGINNKKGGGGGFGCTNTGIAENKNINPSGLNFKIYNGYFNDDISFFTKTKHTNEGIIDSINNITDGTIGIIPANNTRERYSVQWFGYFYANVSGLWKFYVNSDDASYLWIGEKALSGYTTQNALVKNGGMHSAREISATINLTQDTFYPIRIVFGENTGQDNIIISWSEPNNTTKITNGNGNFFLTNISSTDTTLTTSGLGGYNSTQTGGGGGGGFNIFKKNGENGYDYKGGGNGGRGIDINITGTVIGYGGGGGGGSINNSLTKSTAFHGGGSGSIGTNAVGDGVHNTGGGGCGGKNNTSGGYGGSGIAIIKYKHNFIEYKKDVKEQLEKGKTYNLEEAKRITKEAEDRLKQAAKKEDENLKILDDIRKEIINVKLNPINKEIDDKRTEILRKNEEIAAKDLEIATKERELAAKERNLAEQNEKKIKLEEAEKKLNENIQELNTIYATIGTLESSIKTNIENASTLDNNLSKKQIERANADARLVAAKTQESTLAIIKAQEDGIKTNLAQQLADSTLKFETAKRNLEGVSNDRQLLESKIKDLTDVMFQVAKEKENSAYSILENERQNLATITTRLTDQGAKDILAARQAIGDKIASDLRNAEISYKSNIANTTTIIEESNILKGEITKLKQETDATLQKQQKEYNELESQRSSEIKGLDDAIKKIKDDITTLNNKISIYTENITRDTIKSNELRDDLQKLAINIANKTIEYQQYKYANKVLDINSQSTDIGIKIAVNINNTASYIVNNIVLSSLISEHNESIQQKEFIQNADYRSSIDLDIKRRDEKFMIESIYFAMNILLSTIVILVLKNNLNMSSNILLYILCIIYIILFVFFIINIISIVKTNSNKKYWKKPDINNIV